MKLFSIYTPDIAVLKDEWFLKTLKDDWELHLKEMQMPEKASDFGTPAFWKLMKMRLGWLLQVIQENWGEVILWSDMDIQFFKPCQKIIDAVIHDHDLVFQSEWGDKKEVNVGFVAIRCNQKTLSFWQAVLEGLSRGEKEQDAANHILRAGATDCRWTVFPNEVWAYSSHASFPKGIVLHHANYSPARIENGRSIGCLEVKIEQLKAMRRRFKWRYLYIFGRKIKLAIRGFVGPEKTGLEDKHPS